LWSEKIAATAACGMVSSLYFPMYMMKDVQCFEAWARGIPLEISSQDKEDRVDLLEEIFM
jgi:hypothetical protein